MDQYANITHIYMCVCMCVCVCVVCVCVCVCVCVRVCVHTSMYINICENIYVLLDK